MRRDYRLYELNDDEFERLVTALCAKWLGNGITPFAAGRDGGRDGKFHGKANSFPSSSEPAQGHFVLQAKHVSKPDRSFSDADVKKLIANELPKLQRLSAEGICDHYMLFSNRKLTGGAEEQLQKLLLANGPKSAHVIGLERLDLALEQYPDIAATLPNIADTAPFRFQQEDLVEVIGAVHDYVTDVSASVFDSAHDFDTVHIRDVKNPTNKLTEGYYQDIIVAGSMPHFKPMEDFLKNPRNKQVAALYHDAADELKLKIFTHRQSFATFDDVFAFIYEEVQRQRAALKGKRKMITIVLHYMYCNCDIGQKRPVELPGEKC